MSSARRYQTATLLPDDRVLITGVGPGTAELYDPSTVTFSATGARVSGGGGVGLLLLADGKVLIAASPRAVLYDPLLESSIPPESTPEPFLKAG
jgi:hypothetical protein